MQTLTHNIQQTSLFAYESVRPKLGERQREVYEALIKKGEMTDKEIATWLGWEINRVTPRRGELTKMGIIRKARVKYQNGRPALSWEAGRII